MTIQFKQLSENALFVVFHDEINESTQRQIQQAMQLLLQHPFPGLIEMIPSYTNFCVYYDPFIVRKKLPQTQTIAMSVQLYIEKLLQSLTTLEQIERRIIEIPVIYGGEYGPDLQEVAQCNQLTPEQVIKIHTSRDYLVYMLGFAPGFPYLGGLDERISTPRKNIPRLEIAAGSVGIGGNQTGIYPYATPGGWQIIGRTKTELFSLENDPPALLQAGDIVRFVAIEEVASC